MNQQRVIPNLFDMQLQELESIGVDCIADIDHIDMLIAMRHNYLIVAKDLCQAGRESGDHKMGELYCELAEKIQDVIEFWGN